METSLQVHFYFGERRLIEVVRGSSLIGRRWHTVPRITWHEAGNATSDDATVFSQAVLLAAKVAFAMASCVEPLSFELSEYTWLYDQIQSMGTEVVNHDFRKGAPGHVKRVHRSSIKNNA